MTLRYYSIILGSRLSLRPERRPMTLRYSIILGSRLSLKVHKIEIFFGFDFEICIISLLVM
jgi:hypothetical protein